MSYQQKTHKPVQHCDDHPKQMQLYLSGDMWNKGFVNVKFAIFLRGSHISSCWFSFWFSIQVNLEFPNVYFSGLGGRKTRGPGKTIGARQEPATNSTDIWQWAWIDPRPHWWEVSALTTGPSLLPVYQRNPVQWQEKATTFYSCPLYRLNYSVISQSITKIILFQT